MGVLRRRSRRPSTAVADPIPAGATLLAIAEQGRILQERSRDVLVAAARPGERGAALAREGGHLAGEYHRLFGWASDLFVRDANDEEIRRELADLLMYHCQVLHYAMRLAFPKYAVPDGFRRRACVELGEPGERLHELAAQLRG